MAVPTSLFLMATVCCLVVTAAGVQPPPHPSASDRQSRQMYVMPPQLGYNYYLPYGGPIGIPTGGFYPYQLTSWPYPSGESVADYEVEERSSRDSIIVLPAATECLSANVATDGLGPCKKTSGAKHGSISIKLAAQDQTAVIGIVRHSNERITLRCSEMNAVVAFTKTGKISDKSVVRTETGVLQLVVTSTGANGVMKCRWE